MVMMINELNTGLIEALKEKKILNLSGFTNTDLKLEYGVGNLTELTDYDNNYVTLSRSLHLGRGSSYLKEIGCVIG